MTRFLSRYVSLRVWGGLARLTTSSKSTADRKLGDLAGTVASSACFAALARFQVVSLAFVALFAGYTRRRRNRFSIKSRSTVIDDRLHFCDRFGRL